MKIIKKVLIVLVCLLSFFNISNADTNTNTNKMKYKEINPENYAHVSLLTTNVFTYSNNHHSSVLRLQKELNLALGCALDTDGNLTTETVNYVRAFQAKYGLEVDGQTGPITRNKLNEIYVANRVIVKASTLEVRSQTSWSAPVQDTLTQGTIVRVLERIENLPSKWLKIEYGDQKVGYIVVNQWTVAERFVEIDIVSQTLRLYNRSKLILDTPITTGRKDGQNETRTGFYLVQDGDYWRCFDKLLMGGAHSKFWIRFSGGQGLHDASWRTSNYLYNYFGGVVYKNLNYGAGSKYSGSHGCVNIPSHKMPIIYLYAEPGVPIYIH